MIRNPTTPRIDKNCIPSTGIDKQNYKHFLEPDFPPNSVKWNRSTCPPCKGVYTWISSPRAMYNNRKMVKMPTK